MARYRHNSDEMRQERRPRRLSKPIARSKPKPWCGEFHDYDGNTRSGRASGSVLQSTDRALENSNLPSTKPGFSTFYDTSVGREPSCGTNALTGLVPMLHWRCIRSGAQRAAPGAGGSSHEWKQRAAPLLFRAAD